jgi:hypothetical protein
MPTKQTEAVAKWAKRVKAEGRCIACGKNRGDDGTTNRCRPCAKKLAAYQRAYHKRKAVALAAVTKQRNQLLHLCEQAHATLSDGPGNYGLRAALRDWIKEVRKSVGD